MPCFPCVKLATVAAALLSTAGSVAGLHTLDAAHEVITVTPGTFEEAKALSDLSETSEMDFWQEVKAAGIGTDIRVTPEQKEYLSDLFGSSVRSKIADIRSMIDATKQSKSGVKYEPNEYHETYHSIEEVYDFVAVLEETYSDLVSVETIGSSYEGRPLLLACVSTDGCTGGKPAFWMNGGIHAREWISHATVLYIFENLILEHNSGASDLLDKMDFYIAPHINPDGYAFSGTSSGNRLWRKSRKPNPESTRGCVGTDLNRNFAFEWGGVGASTDPCSDTYRGASAADNVEVQAVQRAIFARPEINVYFDTHSYGEYLLSPWGFTADLPKDYTDHQGASQAGYDAIYAVDGTRYTFGASGATLYPTSGSAPDGFYCQATNGTAKYSYTAELPGDRYGFLLPEEFIVPVGKETLEGYKAIARYALENPDCA